MNKFSIPLLLLCFMVFTQCKSVKQEISITQKKVNLGIIIRTASNNNNRAITLQFPKKIILFNNATKDCDLLTINYKYNNIPANRDLNIGLYKSNNDKLERVRNNKKRIITSKGNLSFIFYTRHFVDSSKVTQQQLKLYVKEMSTQNKDTLHIGTVTAFKEKHKELFEKLTKGDSLSIQFLDGKKLGEKITVPVKW